MVRSFQEAVMLEVKLEGQQEFSKPIGVDELSWQREQHMERHRT